MHATIIASLGGLRHFTIDKYAAVDFLEVVVLYPTRNEGIIRLSQVYNHKLYWVFMHLLRVDVFIDKMVEIHRFEAFREGFFDHQSEMKKVKK